MKTRTKILCMATTVFVLALAMTKSNLFAGNANAGTKVEVCHMSGNGKSHTIMVSPSAVAAHLAHGDVLGACI